MRKSPSQVTSPLHARLTNVLFTYRLTPHATTGRSSAELLLSRQPRSLLDVMRPDNSISVRRSQERQKTHHDSHTHSHKFNIEDPVLAKNFGPGPKWLRGWITEIRGPFSYESNYKTAIQFAAMWIISNPHSCC